MTRTHRKRTPDKKGANAPSHPPRQRDRFLLGCHAVTEVIRAQKAVKHVWLVAPLNPARQEIARHAQERGIPLSTLPTRDFEAVLEKHDAAVESAGSHQGAGALCPPFKPLTLAALLDSVPTTPLLLCLDQVTDPHNLGAIIRSAVAFGVDGVVVPQRRSAAISETVSRASAGAIEHVQLAEVVNLAQTLSLLNEQGFQTVGLDAAGTVTVSELPMAPSEGRVLVVGSEGKGLRPLVRKRCQCLARIPIRGTIDSLNASVAASIAIYASLNPGK